MAFQFKIQLKDISTSLVWRRVLVPENFTFDRLHRVIQAAFGWGNYHLYKFSPRGRRSKPVIALSSEFDYEKPDMDACETTLDEVFTTEKQTYEYVYDFGDNWQHKIKLEKIIDDKSLEKASCIGGKGACPPEDCGGTWGYEEFLHTISDPNDPDYEGMREWASLDAGETWEEVAGFKLEEANKAVQEV